MIRDFVQAIGFLKKFHRFRLVEPGLSEASIPAELPDALASLYRDLGALVALRPGIEEGCPPFSAQDQLVPLAGLKKIDGMLEFAWENQGNWSCRCPLEQGDPPVYCNVDDPHGFIQVCSSLSHFLTTLSLQEAVMSSPWLASLDAPAAEALKVPLNPLWLRGHYVFSEPSHDFYEMNVGSASMILMETQGMLFLGATCEPPSTVFSKEIEVRHLDGQSIRWAAESPHALSDQSAG